MTSLRPPLRRSSTIEVVETATRFYETEMMSGPTSSSPSNKSDSISPVVHPAAAADLQEPRSTHKRGGPANIPEMNKCYCEGSSAAAAVLA